MRTHRTAHNQSEEGFLICQPGAAEICRRLASGDEWEGVERAIFLLACAVNRFRNAQGTGHGRPHTSLATDEQGRLAAEASALVSELLLDALK